MLTGETFTLLGDWIAKYLKCVDSEKIFEEYYLKYSEFWVCFPDVIHALNQRT